MLISVLGLLLAGQSLHTIAGHVVRHLDGQPIRGAELRVMLGGDAEKSISVASGDDGEFRFTGIPAGKYDLHVAVHGFWRTYRESDGYWTAIVTGPDLDTEHIRFEFEMPATLSGTVVDEENEPVPQAMVHLFRRVVSNGKNTTQNGAMWSTDENGAFRFRNLEPGIYYVAVAGRPWYAQNRVTPSPQQIQGKNELDLAYPLTYYAGATTAEGAAPIQLQEGQKAHVEVGVRAVPGVHIKLDGWKQPNGGFAYSFTAAGPGGVPVQVLPLLNDGEIVGLAPGSYTISLPAANMQAVAVNVTGDMTLRMNEAAHATVRGAVSPATTGAGGKLEVVLSGRNGLVYQSAAKEDGSFEMPAVLEGKYTLGFMNSTELYFSKVEVKGATYTRGELDVRTGAQVELAITASGGLSELSGVVKREGKLIDGAMVLAIPRDGNQRTGRDQSDGDGTFSLKGLAPGRYALVAIDDGRGLAYAEPKVIEAYLGRAKMVDLPVKEKGEVVEVEVQRRVREE